MVVKETPPGHLLIAVPCPEFGGRVNMDLVQYVLDLRDALGLCNANIGALRRWYDDGTDGAGEAP